MHALPVVVEIVAVEIGVEEADAIQWRTRGAPFDESLGTQGLANRLQPAAVSRQQVRRAVGKTRPVDSRDIARQGVLAIELVIIETPVVQGLEQALEKRQDLGTAGVQGGRRVIQHQAALFVSEVPFRSNL